MTRIRSRAILTLIAAALALSAIEAVNAAVPFRVGTMTVQCYGDHGTSLVLIPGLASGGWVWDDVVGRLKKDHVIYVITLAGFDGTTPVQGKLLDLADDSLLELLRAQHLKRPVLIGHSLGGTLAIRFAEEHSDLISGVVALDGLPVFPGMENMCANQRAGMAQGIHMQMAGMTPAQFAAQQLQYMKAVGVLSEARAVELAARTSRSDPAATAEYMSEDIALDLRPGLASIKVPVLEIAPYNAADFPKTMPMTEAQKTAYYRSLLQGIPTLEVVSIAPSRHFVMVDQPEVFAVTLSRFLAANSAGAAASPSAQKD
jgi:pimeloyl-ACP methyl ester carboxylesterase